MAKTRVVTFRCSPELFEKIETESKRSKIAYRTSDEDIRSSWIRQALTEKLCHLLRARKQTLTRKEVQRMNAETSKLPLFDVPT